MTGITFRLPRVWGLLRAALGLALTLAWQVPAGAKEVGAKKFAAEDPIDKSATALLKAVPGFTDGFADVNGTTLHYVVGGSGEPLVLLPGWPETWWAYNKIMQALSQHYRVIVVDLRGMGDSHKPASGYDKKTLATDVHALVAHLGYTSTNIAGHDIGSQVAYSFAANFPLATRKLVMLDTPPPTEGLLALPLLPAHGTFGDKIDPAHPYFWWFSFHQVKGLPEKILEGRVRLEQDWFFTYMLQDESAIDARSRTVYENAYNGADAIRASNGWYQAFSQDIIDDRSYAKLTMPVLGLGGSGFERLKAVMEKKTVDFTAIKISESGHFVQEEQAAQVTAAMLEFLK